MERIKKNDTVAVLGGKEKGKRGTVLVVDPKAGKVLIKGVNMAVHHVKAGRNQEPAGLRKEEAFIDLCKVMPVCSSCTKPCRVNFIISADQAAKVRVCNRCQAAL